jgi:non-ribosomal peptide synthetase component F
MHMISSTVHELFELRAAQHPKAVAVLCGPDVITAGARGAGQLAGAATVAARRATRRSRRPAGGLHGRMIVASLAAIKAGGAYAALDANWPRAVIEETMRDCGGRVLVTSRSP